MDVEETLKEMFPEETTIRDILIKYRREVWEWANNGSTDRFTEVSSLFIKENLL